MRRQSGRWQHSSRPSSGTGVHLWDASPAAALAAVCGTLGQPITPTEWASYVPGVPCLAACPTSAGLPRPVTTAAARQLRQVV
jgi:hypothetical protein